MRPILLELNLVSVAALRGIASPPDGILLYRRVTPSRMSVVSVYTPGPSFSKMG